MKKIIKKYGSAHVIRLTPEELKIYDLQVDDVIDMTIIKIKNVSN